MVFCGVCMLYDCECGIKEHGTGLWYDDMYSVWCFYRECDIAVCLSFVGT